MNGVSKIRDWLNEHGIQMEYDEYQQYRYSDNFHISSTFNVDCWRLSDGLFLKVKCRGKAMYYLCENRDSLRTVDGVLGFSQDMFIGELERFYCKE